jgi:hypothetical protein
MLVMRGNGFSSFGNNSTKIVIWHDGWTVPETKTTGGSKVKIGTAATKKR